eukprot:XP_011611238.1 PREDICTED: putative nuclease HARBI1 isoform X1 [Takifugu rubripes]
MGGGEQLSEFLRGTIVGCHMCNKSIREISTMLNLPRSTVVSVLLRWKREGSTVALPRSGRPHKLAEEGRQVLQGKAMESGRALPGEFQTASGAKNEHPSHYCVRNRHVLLLTMYTDGQADLRPDFCLSRSTVVKLIGVLRSPFDHGWGLEVEVLVFLFWLASAASYRVVSRGFSIPRSTVYDIVRRMSDKVLSLKNRTIKFPSLVDIPNIAAGFERLSGSQALQNVVGSIGGCHIRIKRPVADAHCYFNRKLFYSIQLQAVCDHQGLFIDIFTGYPGSVPDTQVLRNSPLYVQGLYPPEGYCIVGDGGYPCMSRPIALVTPYREPVTNMMVARFNRHHAKARSVIERAFGIMKTRWRAIFLKPLEVKPAFATKVFACCTILHNVCLQNGDSMEPSEEALGPDDIDQMQPDLQCGEQIRDRLAAALSAPTHLPPALQEHDYI